MDLSTSVSRCGRKETGNVYKQCFEPGHAHTNRLPKHKKDKERSWTAVLQIPKYERASTSYKGGDWIKGVRCGKIDIIVKKRINRVARSSDNRLGQLFWVAEVTWRQPAPRRLGESNS